MNLFNSKMFSLKPIQLNEDKTQTIYANAFCQEIFTYYPEYYYKVGFNPPWIGYFVMQESEVVGACGFTGQPQNGRIEIAYGTAKEYENKGIATFACKELIAISIKTNPNLIITAKTAPEQNASTKILNRNGFTFNGIVQDDGIGDAWEWIYKG